MQELTEFGQRETVIMPNSFWLVSSKEAVIVKVHVDDILDKIKLINHSDYPLLLFTRVSLMKLSKSISKSIPYLNRNPLFDILLQHNPPASKIEVVLLLYQVLRTITNL